jgi:hypothetical protein
LTRTVLSLTDSPSQDPNFDPQATRRRPTAGERTRPFASHRREAMRRTREAVGLFAALLALSVGAGHAADQTILGKRMVVIGSGTVLVVGKEPSSPNTLVGDPRVGGATLTIFANGGTDTSQTIALPAAGWSTPFQHGYGFFGGGTAGPVRFVHIRKTFTGLVVIKALLLARLGAINLVPPNPGDSGGLILQINGGDRYCVTLGGAAGGSERKDDAERWVIRSATAEVPCPSGSPSGAFLDLNP